MAVTEVSAGFLPIRAIHLIDRQQQGQASQIQAGSLLKNRVFPLSGRGTWMYRRFCWP
jgi:hypothetical protein